jgi:hypothetical protein
MTHASSSEVTIGMKTDFWFSFQILFSDSPNFTQSRDPMGNILSSYSGGAGFKYQPGDRYLDLNISWFSQFLQADTGAAPQMKPKDFPPHPLQSLLTNYSIIWRQIYTV